MELGSHVGHVHLDNEKIKGTVAPDWNDLTAGHVLMLLCNIRFCETKPSLFFFNGFRSSNIQYKPTVAKISVILQSLSARVSHLPIDFNLRGFAERNIF